MQTKNLKIILPLTLFAIFACLIFTCTACDYLPINNTNPQSDNRLNEDMHKSLNSLKRVDDEGKLYEMDVKFDYKDQESIKILQDSNLVSVNFACSAFLTHNENNEPVTCRNFDTNHKSSGSDNGDGLFIVYHCHHEGFLKSLSISDIRYLNSETEKFHNGSLDDSKTDISQAVASLYDPLDGVNEKGFTVASLWSDIRKDEPVYSGNNPNAPSCTTGVLMRLMLDQCANVDDAIALAKKYNVIGYIDAPVPNHLFIADKDGNSKVIEWRNNEMRVADTDLSTNFYQTWSDAEPHKIKSANKIEQDSRITKTYKNYNYGYGHGYQRFNIIASVLQQYAELDGNQNYRTKMNNSFIKDLLELVSQQAYSDKSSFTQYSVVYNNQNSTADLWLTRDFSRKYSFSLDYH